MTFSILRMNDKYVTPNYTGQRLDATKIQAFVSQQLKM